MPYRHSAPIGPCLVILVAGASFAAGPLPIRFDVSHTVCCRDVTTVEFAEANPNERLVEARLQISSLIAPGESDDSVEYLYRIESGGPTFQVIDYEPKTMLESDVAGNVSIDQKKEKSHNLGLNVRGGSYGVDGSGTAGAGGKVVASVNYELLPPKETVAASGTVHRGSGVYFKLKPSSQATLEGAKEFVMVMRVPIDWRADYVWVYCEAWKVGRASALSPPERRRLTQESFLVALHAEGDEIAKGVASDLIRSELALRRMAAANQRIIEHRSFSTLVHKFGAMVSLSRPAVNPDWLPAVLHQRAGVSPKHLTRKLPDEVQRAAIEFALAKSRVNRLSGWSGQ